MIRQTAQYDVIEGDDMTTTQKLELAINATWTAQRLCRVYRISPMTVHALRKRGLPCIVIKGDKRPTLRFVPADAKDWIKRYKKEKS